MKKSKHFRKDVIIARIIATAVLILVIAILVFAISLFTKPSGSDKNSQNTENSESVKPGNDEFEDTENSEPDVNIDSESEADSETDSESEAGDQIYVETTTQVKLRKEPNTNCATLDRIDGGTKLLVLESLDGWYKVSHNGQTGYVSADYAKVVEE